jgi:hypothetical protein
MGQVDRLAQVKVREARLEREARRRPCAIVHSLTVRCCIACTVPVLAGGSRDPCDPSARRVGRRHCPLRLAHWPTHRRVVLVLTLCRRRRRVAAAVRIAISRALLALRRACARREVIELAEGGTFPPHRHIVLPRSVHTAACPLLLHPSHRRVTCTFVGAACSAARSAAAARPNRRPPHPCRISPSVGADRVAHIGRYVPRPAPSSVRHGRVVALDLATRHQRVRRVLQPHADAGRVATTLGFGATPARHKRTCQPGFKQWVSAAADLLLQKGLKGPHSSNGGCAPKTAEMSSPSRGVATSPGPSGVGAPTSAATVG